MNVSFHESGRLVLVEGYLEIIKVELEVGIQEENGFVLSWKYYGLLCEIPEVNLGSCLAS